MAVNLSAKQMNALIGNTGFVGSNLASQYKFEYLYNTSNIKEIHGKRFNNVIFCAAQGKKWWANANPDQDRALIFSALKDLYKCSAQQIVLISTVDVLPKINGIDESYTAHAQDKQVCAYGKNRLELEKRITDHFDKVLIVRLPALYGKNLKKNILFDLLNNNQIDKINPYSCFQYYNLDNLITDIESGINMRVPIIHLFPEPIPTYEIVDRFFKNIILSEINQKSDAIYYNFCTKYGTYETNGLRYLHSKKRVFDELNVFLQQSSKK